MRDRGGRLLSCAVSFPLVGAAVLYGWKKIGGGDVEVIADRSDGQHDQEEVSHLGVKISINCASEARRVP